jgi:hypothetical protein
LLKVNGGRSPSTVKEARRFSDGSFNREIDPQKLQKSN